MADLKINTYPKHIGDWRSGTARMSLAEEGAYGRLCDQYYLDGGEGWSVDDALRICRAVTRDEQKAVRNVLASKFHKVDLGYRHDGMDERIREIQNASERNRERSAKAAEKRWRGDASGHASGNATSIAPSNADGVPDPCHPKAKSHKVGEGDCVPSPTVVASSAKSKRGKPVSEPVKVRWPGDPAIRERCKAEHGEAWVLSFLDPAKPMEGGAVEGGIEAATRVAAEKLRASPALKGIRVSAPP